MPFSFFRAEVAEGRGGGGLNLLRKNYTDLLYGGLASWHEKPWPPELEVLS